MAEQVTDATEHSCLSLSQTLCVRPNIAAWPRLGSYRMKYVVSGKTALWAPLQRSLDSGAPLGVSSPYPLVDFTVLHPIAHCSCFYCPAPFLRSLPSLLWFFLTVSRKGKPFIYCRVIREHFFLNRVNWLIKKNKGMWYSKIFSEAWMSGELLADIHKYTYFKCTCIYQLSVSQAH